MSADTRMEMSDRDAAIARLQLRLALGITPLLYPGRRVGELTLLERFAGSNGINARWACRCSCGCELDVQAHNLKSGATQSCGHNKGQRIAHKQRERWARHRAANI